MNLLNAGLQTLATGLVALGASTIASNLLEGSVMVLLGIAVYVIYEITPTKPTA
jgi:hypothetical protein